MADELWNQAETYHGAGLCVIPLKPRSKEPAIMSWKPYQERPPDASERWEWFGEHPDRNIAIVCGKVSGGVDGLSLAVVDFDEGEAYRAWTETHLRLVRSTPIVKTAHGHHVYLRTGESTRCFPIEGGDVKGMGGYVVAPPSIHSDTGTPYELISGDFSSIAVVESLSAIGIEPKRQVRARARRAESWLTEALQGVEEGQRNNTATRLAGYWRSLGMPDDVILAQLLLWNERNRPPLPDSELETIAQSIGHYAPGREEEPATEPPMREEAEGKAEQKPRKKSQAELMVELALDRNITLFLDQSDEPCAQFPIDDHQEIATIASRRFRWWLRGLLFQAYGKPGYHEAVESAVSVLSSMAAFDNPRHYRLWNRVAWGADGDLWYDLADSKWRAVQIAADGWEIVVDKPILFQRFAHQEVQVEPQWVPPGEAAEVLEELWQFVNLTQPDDRLLLLGYLGSTFIPDIPHPIPILHGAQGSGKSICFLALRKLIDPSIAGLLSFSHDGAELIQALSHHWAAFFDNIVTIPDWQQDILCRASTGEGFSKRRLWTDDEDVIYSFRRCVGLNGINVTASRGDLFDRAMLFQLERLEGSSRRTESELWPSFEEKRPRLLGAIFTTLSGAMQVDEQRANALARYFRMADFASWAFRFCEALDGRGDGFVDAYAQSIGQRAITALEVHPLGVAVQAFMDGRDTWQGTPAELLNELEAVADQEKICTSDSAWPGSASWLGRRLREVMVDLKELGIVFEENRDGRRRTITLEKL